MTIASAWRRCTFVTRARTVSPGRPAADEDDEAVEPGDAVPAEGERVDRELELLVSLDGCSHASRLDEARSLPNPTLREPDFRRGPKLAASRGR